MNHTKRLHCSKPSLTATPIPLGPCSSIIDLLNVLNANALACGIGVLAYDMIIKLHLDLLLLLIVIVPDGLETVVCVNQSRHIHP